MHNIPFIFSENIFIKINDNNNKIKFIARSINYNII
jgi:hypothetical protein